MIKISDLFKASDEYASILPKIIFESAILSRNIIEGLHASRISGKGEDFGNLKIIDKAIVYHQLTGENLQH